VRDAEEPTAECVAGAERVDPSNGSSHRFLINVLGVVAIRGQMMTIPDERVLVPAKQDLKRGLIASSMKVKQLVILQLV